MTRRSGWCWAVVTAALLAGGLSCKSSVDPSQGRFSCQNDVDCGPGYGCWKQAGGDRGFCYATGECLAEESCNGRDDNCNGQIDESFTGEGSLCDTGVPGVCAEGSLRCVEGAVTCAQATATGSELCDGRDNDCDGQLDEGFDFTRDSLNCGGCGKPCPLGTLCRESGCHESNCANGADDDGDGLIDCNDDDCRSLACNYADPQFNCGLAYPGVDGGTDGGELDGGGFDGGELDGGGLDAGDLDGGGFDGGELDGGELDGGGFDAGELDGGETDGGGFDGGELDGGPDAGGSDGGDSDGGNTDAGEVDGGPADGGPGGEDGGSSDAGAPDAGETDGGLFDGGIADAGEDAGATDGGTLDGGELDGGALDGGPVDAGEPVRSCVPREANCANGIDDDFDGLKDCADDDCTAKECRVGGTCSNGTCPP